MKNSSRLAALVFFLGSFKSLEHPQLVSGTTRNASGVFMADAKGPLRIENLTSEDIEDLVVECECDDRSHPARERVFVRLYFELGLYSY